MLHLQWLAFFAIAVTFAVVAHYAFWGWVYRERGDSDALLTAIADDGWRLAVAHYKPETPSDRQGRDNLLLQKPVPVQQ